MIKRSPGKTVFSEAKSSIAAPASAPPGMVYVPGGTFTMGSEGFYPEEAPIRQVRVDGFFMDQTPVTNAAFARFVEETGHVSWAEIAPDPNDYPGMAPEMALAGSAVFFRPNHPVDLRDPAQWWTFTFGADWRHPAGPGSSLTCLEDHPVVHISVADAEAYARWAGKSLPTEAEWEFAARGGLEGADYAWGDELAPAGQRLANYWEGLFPAHRSTHIGPEGTSAVGEYPANGYGLSDMIGNVWEWTSDWYAAHKTERKGRDSCCIPSNPRGGRRHDSFDPSSPARTPRKVLKGGSYLCAANYCQRYRPAARRAETIDTTACHVGFRCIVRAGAKGKTDPGR